MDSWRDIYYSLVPEETRFWFYKLRHWKAVSGLQTAYNPSPKGDFSLRRYTASECLFIHITKAAGTSVAMSLIGELPYHYTAWQYRVIYGRRRFNRFFKFAFVRNPWDRLYSAYSYLKGGGWNDNDAEWAQTHLGNIDDFNTFVLEWLTEERLRSHIHLWPQLDFICDRHGTPMIDQLCYFETIEKDFTELAKRLNPDATLAHTNASQRESYQHVYSEAAKDKVKELYHDDIECLGYTFNHVNRRTVRNGRFC